MTLADKEIMAIKNIRIERPLLNGDVVDVMAGVGQPADISVNVMCTKERMLLGIPLNPDTMKMDDWDALPGIGPALAQSIVMDRQKNGEFGSLSALMRVPGVGEKLLLRINKYF